MAIDPSGRGTDETAYAVVKHLHGYLFLLAAGGFKGGYEDDTLIGLARIAKLHQINLILVEDNFGGGMFAKLFQPVLLRLHKCKIEEITHRTQKEKRIIDTLEPVMNRHKLIVDYSVVDNDLKMVESEPGYSLFYQLSRVTKDRGSLRYDDRLDVLAMAAAYWVDSMSRDEDLAVDDHKARELEQMLKDFADHVIGKRQVQKSKNWLKNQLLFNKTNKVYTTEQCRSTLG
jgi:hypothetical protein